MAYTTSGNHLIVTFRDVRDRTRNRTVELGGLIVVTDGDATLFHAVSKSAVRKYAARNTQLDTALTADADSESGDTLRLYFLLDDDSQAHFDIVDGKDILFLSTTGEDANIVKPYATLAAAGAGTPMKSLADIIDNVLSGRYLVSDGETPVAYLRGERIV